MRGPAWLTHRRDSYLLGYAGFFRHLKWLRYIAYVLLTTNNLRHEPGDMHITATVTFVRIYDKIMKIA